MRRVQVIPYLAAVLAAVLLVASCGSSEPQARPPGATPTSTSVPSEPTEAPPTPTPAPSPNDCAALIPDRLALAQLVLSLATPAEFDEAVKLSADGDLGGVGLLGLPTAEDLARLSASPSGPFPLVVASDEEGGPVQRLGPVLGTLPSAASLASRPLEEISATFEEYGAGLAELGVHVAFAPVVDVGGGPGIGARSFSSDPESVIRNAGAVVDGYIAAGITPVIKHFPGHGGASGDTHQGFATTRSLDQLRERDLIPFAELASPDVWVMVGHLLVPGLTDDDVPTSLSPAAIDGLLRRELGFDGIVITDALGMGAISNRWPAPEASRLALVAGADMVIVNAPYEVVPVLDHLVASLADGSLSRSSVDDSLVRVLDHKGVDPCEASRRLGSPP
jgi:beta-N-acetylhexosaminidase